MRCTLRGICLSLTAAAAIPCAAEAQDQEPAQGLALWIRTGSGSLPDLVASGFGSPQFYVGYRGSRATVGLGVGLTVAGVSSTPGRRQVEDELSATMFQLGPAGSVDLWSSADGLTRGSIAAGVSLGRLSLVEDDQWVDFNGHLQTQRYEFTGTLVGVFVGLGGDHFLHRHFAIGVEGGVRAHFALDLTEAGTSDQVGLSANGAYGAIKAMIVF